MQTHRLTLVGFGLIIGGCVALAASAWLYQAANDDLPNLVGGPDGVEALAERFDRAARAAGLGVGLLAAGPAVMVLAWAEGSVRPRAMRLAAWTAIAATVLLVMARFGTFDARGATSEWSRWMGLEALGWAALAIALGYAAWLRLQREREAPADLVHPVAAKEPVDQT